MSTRNCDKIEIVWTKKMPQINDGIKIVSVYFSIGGSISASLICTSCLNSSSSSMFFCIEEMAAERKSTSDFSLTHCENLCSYCARKFSVDPRILRLERMSTVFCYYT